MNISRRRLLTATGTAVAASAVTTCGFDSTAQAATVRPLVAIPPGVFGVGRAGTTLASTVLPGTPNSQLYRTLVPGAGEPYIVRTDITGAAAITAPTAMLAAFAHLSDLHIIDDQSPARVEYLDQYANPGNPHQGSYPTGSAYRPQEFMSVHLVDAMARSLRKVGFGPRTSLPLSFAVVTGDAVDNAQRNETRWYISLLDGGLSVTNNSGDPQLEESVSGGLGAFDDVHLQFWHPEEVFPQNSRDFMFTAFGYQPMPGLLAAARKPFVTTGVGIPWLAVYGNHDLMVQGNLSTTFKLPFLHSVKFLAVNGGKVLDSTDPLPALFSDAGKVDGFGFLIHTVGQDVTPDPDRRLLSTPEFVQEHFNTHGLPIGHGFQANSSVAYYAVPDSANSLIRYITLDSTNPDGGVTDIETNASGCIDDTQLLWLEEQLIANSSHYLDQFFIPRSQPGVQDKLFVIFCHHTIATMTNLAGDNKHDGTELASLLLRFPNVVLLANGHTHRNEIVAHPRGADTPARNTFGPGGFWEVSAASHIDWPIQSRIIELGVGGDTLSIFTSVVDIDAPLSSVGSFDTPAKIASIARELAVNDPQEHFEGGQSTLVAIDMATSGRRGDNASHRNAQLTLPMPFPIPAFQPVTGPRFFAADPGGVLTQSTDSASASATGLSLNLAPGTAPAAAATTFGSWLAVFQRDNGELWQVTSHGANNGVGDSEVRVAAGTSPAVAALPAGNLAVAFQTDGDNGLLFTFTPDSGFLSAGILMQAGTSPAIAALPQAGNFVVAAHGSDKMLWVTTAAGNPASTSLPLRPGTSPAVASSPAGAYTIAFQGSDSTLWFLTHTGFTRSMQTLMAEGTSPAIAALPGGGFAMAFHHADGTLWTVAANLAATSTSLPMAPGTSPGISAVAGGFEVSFQHTNGNLWVRSASGQATDMQVKMVAGSSPASTTSFFNFPAKV